MYPSEYIKRVRLDLEACHGDSGGPVLAEVGGNLRVVGVLVSVVDNGSSCSAPGFYEPLFVGESWIEANLPPSADTPEDATLLRQLWAGTGDRRQILDELQAR